MSSSTVALTANAATANSPSLAFDSNSNPSVRRRSAAVQERKSNNELTSEGGRISGGKDLSHSIRGETVLDRKNALSQARKVLINSTTSPRRRKVVPKPEKRSWRTILRIIMKNLLLLLAMAGFVQAYRKWGKKPDDVTLFSAGVLDFEGRISEVESFLKKTAKMIQVQVEVVDKKLDKEIGSLRNELTKKTDDKVALIEKELKRLGDKADKLDKSLGGLKDAGFLSKQEFERFLNVLRKDNGEEDLSLDKIRAVARDIVEKEIEKHAADGLGMVDYAVGTGGGMVVKHSEPLPYDKSGRWLNVGKSRNGVHNLAAKILEPSFGQPGHCFPLKGSSGFVEVRLRTAVFPEAITLEHVAKSVAYDRSSAPRDCRVSGWQEGQSDPSSDGAAKMFLLTEFTYDLEKSNAQTFNIDSSNSHIINMVRLDFTSNHGSPSHTCIYRLRVHGREPESVALLDRQP